MSIITPRQTEERFHSTRRDFIRAAAGLSLLGVPAAEAWARARRAEPLKVGLIGCGGRGTGAALQAIKADPGSVLWSMGDVWPERIEGCLGYLRSAIAELEEDGAEPSVSGGAVAWREKINVDDARKFTGFDAWRRVIGSGVDVVLLCTPPNFRAEHLRGAVDAGKHVFCEKPVAVDAPGVRSVLDSARIAREKRLSLMSGFCWRYSTREREIYEQIHAGRIGEIRHVYTNYNTTGWIEPQARRPEWSDTEFMLRNWQYFVPLSGDHIVEQAVHAIDKLRWATNDRTPLRCIAVGGREVRPELAETGNCWDHFAIVWDYEDGLRATHMCRHWPNSASDNADYIAGSEGYAIVNGWTGTHVIEGARPWKGTARGNDMYQQEHDELFASIRAGAPINDGERMSNSTLQAIMGRMAAYTGQVVTWEQAMSSSEDLNPQAWAWGTRALPTVARPGSTRLI
ncbi:MAG: Gfo/Idh/MocA family oxidoreductase [Phycisphaerales bacterium]|jgi:predicted dehydrogenase|nr:Gfo/Idh/MocA family oxidoreductase [Phycisphaerales bacterium]